MRTQVSLVSISQLIRNGLTLIKSCASHFAHSSSSSLDNDFVSLGNDSLIRAIRARRNALPRGIVKRVSLSLSFSPAGSFSGREIYGIGAEPFSPMGLRGSDMAGAAVLHGCRHANARIRAKTLHVKPPSRGFLLSQESPPTADTAGQDGRGGEEKGRRG